LLACLLDAQIQTSSELFKPFGLLLLLQKNFWQFGFLLPEAQLLLLNPKPFACLLEPQIQTSSGMLETLCLLLVTAEEPLAVLFFATRSTVVACLQHTVVWSTVMSLRRRRRSSNRFIM
jgi:hypothetical protein